MGLTHDHIVGAWTAVAALATCVGVYIAWRHFRLQNRLSQLKKPLITVERGLLSQPDWCTLNIEVRNVEERSLELVEVKAVKPSRMRLLYWEWAHGQAPQPWEARPLRDPLPLATHKSLALDERLSAAGSRRNTRKTASVIVFAYCPPSKYFVYRPEMIRLLFRWRDERAEYFSMRAKVLPARLRD